MTHRIATLIQHATAIALAALVTLAALGSIDGLASRDLAPGSLMARAAAAFAQA